LLPFLTAILVFTLSIGFIYSAPFSSAQAQDNFDLNGVWERDDKAQVNIEQAGSEVIAKFDSPIDCQGGLKEGSDPSLQFKGTIEGNQIFGEESAWCYYDSAYPDGNGLFLDPFQATISDDGNQLTLFSSNRFSGVEDSIIFSKISGPASVESSPPNGQPSSTTDQLRDTFTSTLSQVENTLDSNNENFLLIVGVVAVVVIGAGVASFVKHHHGRSSTSHSAQDQTQQEDTEDEQIYEDVQIVTQGGIEEV
jgi:hypothetical protein